MKPDKSSLLEEWIEILNISADYLSIEFLLMGAYVKITNMKNEYLSLTNKPEINELRKLIDQNKLDNITEMLKCF